MHISVTSLHSHRRRQSRMKLHSSDLSWGSTGSTPSGTATGTAKKGGIPPEQWCYSPNEDGRYRFGMETRDRLPELEGYRLPTQAEWEFACRSRTLTSRYYGSTPALLPYYDWLYDNCGNERRQVGLLKPNDFGLFDMLGNAAEWNFDNIGDWHPVGSIMFENDRHSSGKVQIGEIRPIRGARSVTRSHEPEIRSCGREGYRQLSYRTLNGGLRPVSTIPARLSLD